MVQDFVDEDTGEVVSIERNEVLLDRDVVRKRSCRNYYGCRSENNFTSKKCRGSEYAIIHNTLQKDPTNSEKEAVSIYTDNFVMLSRLMKKLLVVLSINYSSLKPDIV